MAAIRRILLISAIFLMAILLMRNCGMMEYPLSENPGKIWLQKNYEINISYPSHQDY